MKINRLPAIIGFMAMLASCTVEPVFEPVPEEDGRIPLNIDGSIDQVATRATAAGFVDGDAVGLFAVNYQENNTVAGVLAGSGNQADNVKYVFDEANHKWVPVKPVYYKNINTNVDLYLYYPYEGTINDVNAANFEVKKDQSTPETVTELSGYEASDWMWGKATGITPSESKVQIPLSHRLSAVQVTLNKGTGWQENEFESISKGVILTNTTRKAQLDFATGDVTAIGAPQLDGIIMCPQTDGTFRAVVIPQSVVAGTQLFAITVNGISYSFTQSDPVTYLQGKQLNVAININKKTPTGQYEFELANTQIVAWTEDQNTHGGEARQYFVVNVETPGTLGDLIAAEGKNPAKIRNLKVTGNINQDDFYFMRDQMSILEAINMKECQPIGHLSRSADSQGDSYERNLSVYGEPDGTEWGSSVYWDKDMPMIPDDAFAGKKTLTKFVFPENISLIGLNAFSRTNLSGAINLPDCIKAIENGAFSQTLISSITFPASLIVIAYSAFNGCSSLSGELLFPSSLREIGAWAFEGCRGLSGTHLRLPANLEYIAEFAFANIGTFIGDFIVPEKVTSLPEALFFSTSFTGTLDLANVQELGSAFQGGGFIGHLSIPEGVVEIPNQCFMYCGFTSISFPSSLRRIGDQAFLCNSSIMEPLVFPEGLVLIGGEAFRDAGKVPSVHFPSSLQNILSSAFCGNSNISQIICDGTEPPTLAGGVFDGVAKDNFTVGVPSQSVTRYQTELGWSDFKRIAAHYDFSLSRRQMRTLNGSISRTFVLRAPACFSWSILDKPDWVTVSPASGTGKTDVTITVSEMARTSDTFETNEGQYNSPSYVNYNGRKGQVIFGLDGRDCSFTFDIEQYDYDYSDGSVQTLHSATSGPGIDIVFTGDGYDARDLAKGTFLDNAEAGYNHLFDLEPYKTYKEYFNVYAVFALSDESGIGSVNTIIDTKFHSTLTQNRILLQSQDEVFAWAKNADGDMVLSKSLVILLQNTSIYEGITYLYTDGSAIACCPVSTQEYPYDFRGIIQHEAGGHGFGKLGDEYIYHNAFIQNCSCLDGCEHPQGDNDQSTMFGIFKSLGWYKNLSMTSDPTRVPWAHLVYNPQYSDYVDMYEGGLMHTRGMYRSESTSCMNNNIPYYSAISRQAIVERIKYCAGEEFSLEDFYSHDNASIGTITRAGGQKDRTFGVDPHMNHATGHGPILVGEHPNVK